MPRKVKLHSDEDIQRSIRMIGRLMNATVIASFTVQPSGALNIKLRFLLTMKGIITVLV